MYSFEKATSFATEVLTDFLQDSLGTQTRVVDRSQTKLQADTVTKATVGSWIIHILCYHFWSLCGFQKLIHESVYQPCSSCAQDPSEKSQIGDSKQDEVGTEEASAKSVRIAVGPTKEADGLVSEARGIYLCRYKGKRVASEL